MKYILSAILLLFCAQAASAEGERPVVYFPDGSTYTLKGAQKVYVSAKIIYSVSGDYAKIILTPVQPVSKRDYIESTDPVVECVQPGVLKLGPGDVVCEVPEPVKTCVDPDELTLGPGDEVCEEEEEEEVEA
jgi:hypothetical protein